MNNKKFRDLLLVNIATVYASVFCILIDKSLFKLVYLFLAIQWIIILILFYDLNRKMRDEYERGASPE